LFTMLNETGLAVMAATNNLQQPWLAFSPISGPVILNPSGPIPTTPPLLARRPPPDTPVPSPVTLDLIQRAYQQLDSKDYARAGATLTEAINADENFAPAYSFRGFAWYLEGLTKDPQNALVAYQQGFSDFDIAIRLDPKYAPVRRHRGNTN